MYEVACGFLASRPGETGLLQELRRHRRGIGGDPLEDRLVHRHGVGHVERNERLVDRLTHDDAGRLGIVPDVHLGGRRRVARHLERAAHVHDALDQAARSPGSSGWPARCSSAGRSEQRHLVRVFLDGVDDEGHRMSRCTRAVAAKPSSGAIRSSSAGSGRLYQEPPTPQSAFSCCKIPVVVDQRVPGARIDADASAMPKPLDGSERVGDFLRQPLVARPRR